MQRKPHISLRDLDDREVIQLAVTAQRLWRGAPAQMAKGDPARRAGAEPSHRWEGRSRVGRVRAQSKLLSHPNLRWQY